jgi:DNA-binding MarR family transcriptional regulator
MAALRADLRHCAAKTHPAHLRALIRISHGSMTVGDLAEAFEVSAPTASRTVSHLEENGLVRRVRDPRDRRRYLVELTPEGRERLGTILQASQRRVAEMLAGLDEDDLRSLEGGIAVLRDVLAREHSHRDGDATGGDGSGGASRRRTKEGKL